MKNNLLSNGAFIICLLSLFSCSKEIDNTITVKRENGKDAFARKEAVSSKAAFAKVLAKAVKNADVRKLIKDEAVKKFDTDYDVLLQMVKDKNLSNGKTLINTIAEQSDNKEYIKEIPDNLPLLTLFVPNYYSAEKWTDADIPIIVYRDENNKLIAVSDEGETVEISDTKQPYLPIIVVKNNDRVTTRSLAQNRSNDNTFIFSNGKENFYFIDASFNNLNNKERGARRVDLWQSNPFDAVIVEAYNRTYGCNYCSQRDWIYYGIDARTGLNSGPLSIKFQEAVTAFEPTSTAITSVIGGWDEGNYVFVLTPILGDKNASTVNANNKTIPIRPEDIYLYTERIEHYGLFGMYTRIVRDITGVKPYTFPSPITFVNWDMEKYGDRWGLVLEEYDQTQKITKTFKNTVTFGTNFSATVGSKDKLGASLGASATTTKETTTVYESEEGNDAVGNATIEWTTPVLTLYNNNIIVINDPKTAITYEANTGSMKISFEPVRVAP